METTTVYKDEYDRLVTENIETVTELAHLKGRIQGIAHGIGDNATMNAIVLDQLMKLSKEISNDID